jgi:hypothetical protein
MATNYLKAGGMFKFTDTAEDDLYIFPAKNCEMIEITNNTSVILTFSQSGDHAVQNVDLTCTADKADEVAAIMADYLMSSGGGVGGGAGLTEFAATTAPITDVTGIATAKSI